MNLQVISSSTDLINAVIVKLPSQGLDYSASQVIFPNTRPAFYLLKQLGGQAGKSFIPPAVYSLDVWIDHCYETLFGMKHILINNLDALALLYEIHQSAPNKLGGNFFLNADSFFPLGMKILRDLEDMKNARVPVNKIQSINHLVEEQLPPQTMIRMQSLSLFYERFYQMLNGKGYSTRASRSDYVTQNIDSLDLNTSGPVVLAGFYNLTATERELFKGLLKKDNVTLIFKDGLGLDDLFKEMGFSYNPEKQQSESIPYTDKISFYKSPDTHGQVLALNQIMKDQLSHPETLNDSQVIVLPAIETLFPLYQQTLSSLNAGDYNISLGYALSRTPLYSFFDKVLELISTLDEEGRVYTPNYLKFILHPYTKNIYYRGPGQPRSDLTRILMHTIEDCLLERKSKGFWSLEELESDSEIRQRLGQQIKNMPDAPPASDLLTHLQQIHKQILGPFLQIKDTGDFFRKLMGVLNYIYENSTAQKHYLFHPFSEAFLSQLESMSNSLMKHITFNETSSYINLFKKVIESGSVPFRGTPLKGLQVLGFWETRNIAFQEIYLLDANEDVLPSGHRWDSLLPLMAREVLGMKTYKDTTREMEYYLDLLIQNAQQVHLFFVESEDKERSRFVEKLLWKKQKYENQKDPLRYIQTVEYKVDLAGHPLEAVKKTDSMITMLEQYTYSSTALDKYLNCPLQFYYSYVLNLQEKEEITGETDKAEIGSLVHIVLEDYLSEFKGKMVQAQDLREDRLSELIEKQYAEHYGREVTGSAYLLKLQIHQHLQTFLKKYQIPLIKHLAAKEQGLYIESLEQKIKTEYLLPNGKTVRLVAKVDRIEKRGGYTFILDYKTGANHEKYRIKFKKLILDERDTWNLSLKSIQLPFYNFVYTNSNAISREDQSINPVYCCFLLLGKTDLNEEIEFDPYNEKVILPDLKINPNKEEMSRDSKVMNMEKIIKGLLTEILDPEIDFSPTVDPVNSCKYCPFTNICNQ